MSKPTHLLIYLSITTLLNAHNATAIAPTHPHFFNSDCKLDAGNYTANSTYETNLRSVLSDLQHHAYLELFYNSSAGSGANTVYAQYYCRGDIDTQLCSECIKQAAQSLFVGNCTLFKTAIIWYEECNLRYSNESTVGVMSVLPRTWASCTNNVSDPVNFASDLGDTVNMLINESTQGTKPSLFATGSSGLSVFVPVYCLVQCSPGLNGTDCETCLRSAYAFIPTCCGGMSKHVAIFYATCQLRYSTFGTFYAPPTPPEPAGLTGSGTTVSEPAGSPPSTNNTSTRKRV